MKGQIFMTGEMTPIEIEAEILSFILERESNGYPHKVIATKLTDAACEQILAESRGAKHIEEVISHYDSEDDPTWCTWQDVEGLNYGWMWLKYREEHMKEMMIAYISGTVRAYQKRMDDGEEFTLVKVYSDEYGDTVTFHVMDVKENQFVYTWTFSNKDTLLA